MIKQEGMMDIRSLKKQGEYSSTNGRIGQKNLKNI